MECCEVRETDLAECLNIEPRSIGDEIVGRETALQVWRQLIRSPSFNSAKVSHRDATGRNHIVGFGASVFVTSGFASQELESPRPYLTSRVIACIARDCPVIRQEAELAGDACGDALDVVILYGNYTSGLTVEQIREIEMLLPYGFAEVHAGYRLGRILNETVGEVQFEHVRSSGVWRIVQQYPGERCLFVLTKEEAFGVSGSLAASLFHFEAPTLGLHPTDKQLLAEALRGGIDTELAAKLHLTLSSVKKRWRSLYERVAETRPELVPGAGEGNDSDARGPQKRHRVLEYVRAHPSEIRPFR